MCSPYSYRPPKQSLSSNCAECLPNVCLPLYGLAARRWTRFVCCYYDVVCWPPSGSREYQISPTKTLPANPPTQFLCMPNGKTKRCFPSILFLSLSLCYFRANICCKAKTISMLPCYYIRQIFVQHRARY